MSPRTELYAAADEVAEYAVANHIGLHTPDFSPIRPSTPCLRAAPTRVHQATLSSPRITALCEQVADARLNAHLDALDAAETLEQAARRHLSDKHIAAALEQLFTKTTSSLKGWAPTQRESARLELFEEVDALALELATKELEQQQ